MASRARLSATNPRRRVWTTLAYIVAAIPMVPAVVVNVDTTHAGSVGWATAAGVSIVMGAVFFECSLIAKGAFRSLGFLSLSIIIVLGNVQNAMINASATSDDRADHRKSAIDAAKRASSQRIQWSQGRNEHARVAGETPVAAVQAEIDGVITSEAGRWRATGECDLTKITAGRSRAFCSEVWNLKAKLAAAQARDDLDRKIATLDAKREEVDDVPSVVDPFVECVMSILAVAGVNDTSALRDLISASRNWTRAILLELMAVAGPSAILMLLLQRGTREPTTPRVPRKARRSLVENTSSSASTEHTQAESTHDPDTISLAADDPINGFIASEMEEHVGAVLPAGTAWQLWQRYCAERGIEAGTQRSFGSRLKRIIAWESNSNRPRYLNVRTKQTVQLRVVASNGSSHG